MRGLLSSSTVSEKRKLFERLSGNEAVASPVVTHATRAVTAPLPVQQGHSVSAPRASKAIDTDASARPAVSPPHGIIPGKSHSVADMCKVFERELQASSCRFSTTSLPNTLERARSVKSDTRDRQAADSIHPFQADINWLDRGARDSEPTPTRPPLPVVQCPRTPTVRRVEGKALRAALVEELSRTIKHRARESLSNADMTDESPVKTSGRELTKPQLLLLPRASLPETQPQSPGGIESAQRQSDQRHAANETPKEVAGSHNSLPESSSSPYLQYWQAVNDAVAMKSSPSLPNIVFTAMPDAARKELRHIPPSFILLAGPNKIRKTRHRHKRRRRTHTPPKMKALSNSSAAGAVSPVRDRIHQFEQISHPTGREADPHQLRDNTPESPSSSIKRPYAKAPSTWGLRRGSEGLRALSFSRRKGSTSNGDDEVFQGYGKRKSSISFLGRFSASNFDGPHTAEHHPHPGPQVQRKLSTSIKATLRKISSSKHRREESAAAAALAALKTLPSVEVLNKTAMLAPGPLRLTGTGTNQPGAILTKPKSYSALTQGGKENCPSITRSLASRSSWKEKTAAAKPVLSPAPAQARDLTTIANANANHASQPNTQGSGSGGSSISQSWGRRAAAAAFDIGRRRFNGGVARKTSASSVSSSSARLTTLLRTKGSLSHGLNLDAGGGGFVY
ncbi:uncharacterized protein B0T15DRAFT_555133 [Chaetomium strumarium]|uniref:Uncharacterized protein n=1 Tax=Chaetomium strumarium TaxID=1170767 RepID=A0AAJ0GSN7_9PEZI|nr:hypothetical protein B0T15DRAFT_555133 [Chaetomium strumarium]